MLVAAVHGVLHFRDEVVVERLHHIRPCLLALGDLIEVLLHLGGEVIVHDLIEVFHQEVVHYDTDVRRNQFALLGADNLLAGFLADLSAFQRDDGKGTLFTFLVTLLYVLTLLDGGDGGGVC